jgi:hypothetical protein
MKHYLSLILLFYLSYLHVFAETYVWEDYDDFSGSNLDTSKWDVGYFEGGQNAVVSGGKAELIGTGFTGSDAKLTPAPWVGAVTNSIGQSNSGIFLKSVNVNGLEVEVTIPTSGNSENVGFIIETYSEELSTYNGIELAWRQNGLSWSFENEYPSSGQLYEIDQAANFDETYKVAVIHTGSRMEMYINGERVANINSTFSPSHWLIGSFNDDGNPFSVSIDNVNILRQSSETLNGSSLFLDSDDPVSLTLEFENNLITSTFEDNGGTDSGTESGISYDYIISDESIFSITFTDTIVGDYLTFDRSTNRGKLYDFKDDGQIDTSGTWEFTFETIFTSTVAISDPNGQPVVVQVGEDYQWNDTLDGVMLWGVWQDDDTNEWVIATVNYIGGRQKGAKGSYSSLPAELDVDHPYIVDGDTIDVTETNGHQYYQVTSVDNGIIYAVDGDGAPLTDPSWWFVAKAAAEEFYNSKINYAPESLDGLTVKIHDLETSPGSGDYGEDTKYFVSQQVYSWEENQLESTTFSYVKNSASSATLTIHHDSGATKTIHDLTFSSENSATGTWREAEETVTYTGTTTFTIIHEDYASESLNGWNLDAGASTYKFAGDSTGVFYDEDSGNFSNSELSNISYTWEKIGPSIGKLTTDLGEETLLFFESNTSGFFDWEEIGSDDGNSGQFELYYYQSGKAFESLVGSSLSIGDTSYVFTSTNAVTVHSPSGKSSQEYAYLRENENVALLSVGSYLYKLHFHNNQYGRIIEGGSVYFSIHQNWATKGWVYYDDLPWIYSNNQGEWMYQVLSNNNETNETELMYFEPWTNLLSQNLDLKFTDKVFSAESEFYWEDYDDFSGPELNSSKWDVAWWDGGTAPSIDQANNRVEFTKGSSYEANLSDLMNLPNPNAESEYSRGYSTTSGNAPSSLVDLVVFVAETVVYSDGTTDYYGEDEIYFSETHRSRWDEDENITVTDPYSYTKTGSDTATLTINKSGATYTAQLTFVSPTEGTGNWTDFENGETESGTLTFKVEYSPHSLLEFVQSDDIEGIEFELMIPNDAPDQTCIGLFAVDYNAMFNATSDEQEEGAIKFDLDLCYFNGLIEMEFNHKDTETGEENSTSQSAQLGVPQKIAFYYHEGRIYFFHNDQLVKDFPYERGNEKFVIRAQNEQNLDFSAYLRNVRELRKKSYPQGWMWTEFYPWAYSHETGGWLYFELAKDSDGNSVMNYYDHNSGSWDLYGPSLNKLTDR